MTPAVLALQDGTLFHGVSVGADGKTIGEVVFNTAMTGYQEILTDPSYCRQIVTLTYPHIGNTGTNSEDFESRRVFAAGLVIRDRSIITSNYRSEQSLTDFLRRGEVVAIADIDTRRLTRHLRTHGAQSGCIMAGEGSDELALKHARRFPGIAGSDLADFVSVDESYQWAQGTVWPDGEGPVTRRIAGFHVVAYDFGIKRNILRLLCDQDCRVTVVPARTPAEEVLEMAPDGVFLSNGPGDPEPCDYAIAAAR
ncbi:MAG: carbamoyl phosphate synthase small subunit, partial [Pseudomonadota bacterium]